MPTQTTPTQVLDFWFTQLSPQDWFTKSDVLDKRITQNFGDLLRQAGRSELYAWRTTPESVLAEVLVLDQFSRNVYRDTPLSFANDPLALAVAQMAIGQGFDQQLPESQRTFLYMPFMHSESPYIHRQAIDLFASLDDKSTLGYEQAHKAIIDRFGRYPHRNAILGRESTPEEREFLTQPGSSF